MEGDKASIEAEIQKIQQERKEATNELTNLKKAGAGKEKVDEVLNKLKEIKTKLEAKVSMNAL
jgi:septation ring formation regulator EzrA